MNNSSTGDKFHFPSSDGRRRQQQQQQQRRRQPVESSALASSRVIDCHGATDLLQQQQRRFTTRDSHPGGEFSSIAADAAVAQQSNWRTTEPNPLPPTPPTQRSASLRQYLSASVKRSLARINGQRKQAQHKSSEPPPGATKQATSRQQLIEMVRKRCLLALTCFTIFLVACLLGSLVISRSIGPGGDLDSDSGAHQAASQVAGRSSGDAAAPPPEVFERRTFELVDLIECDKTFAYTKWRVQVRVRKSTPAYEQHNLAPQLQATASSEPIERREISKPEAPAIGREPAQQRPDEDQYHLTGTRGFVADHQVAAGDLSLDPLRDPEAAAIIDDFEDPIQVAASELQVDVSAVNSSLVDCFIVDTDKRYGQKLAIEARHERLAASRRVGFKKMLATITACRLLSWTELTSAAANKSMMSLNVSSSAIPAQQRLVKRADQPTATTSGRVPFLNDIIRPVEPRAPPASSSNDPLNTLIGALVTWSRQPPSNNNNNDSRQRVSTQSTTSDTSKSATKAAEEEAKRASYLNMGMSMVSGIVPNTLWCGLGDRAANYSELGAEFMVDACCRAHDHCPIRLKPFTTDYGLINWSMSTRSHCDCDLDFSDCLGAINSTLSNVIKTLYFRFVGLQCIDLNGRKLTSTTSTAAAATTTTTI